MNTYSLLAFLLQDQQSQFQTYLDKNKDGVLDKEELKEWLTPDYDQHDAEAQRMLHDTDDNQDQKLSKDEMLNYEDYYLGLIPPEYWRKHQQYLDSTTTPVPHDEF